MNVLLFSSYSGSDSFGIAGIRLQVVDFMITVVEKSFHGRIEDHVVGRDGVEQWGLPFVGDGAMSRQGLRRRWSLNTHHFKCISVKKLISLAFSVSNRYNCVSYSQGKGYIVFTHTHSKN
ncbi:hypothetical protein L2E82_32531 [Cichorium intybus]|uniref:Uncharacterized protein n=1 Tax=Cichorium intybus TaxID=13427 RepID=A0ACB9BGK7_CICIN|nr:hypothetical protein L2E82_32531 [Cichorium intybus]